MDAKKDKTLIIGVIGLLVVIVLAFFLIKACANKEYTVTFNSNGGSAVSSQKVQKGDKVVKPSDPTRDGYTFAGWYLNLNDSTPYDFNKEVTEDITLTAKWTKNAESNTCTLTCGEGETLDPDNCTCVKEEENDTDNIVLSVNYRNLSLVVGDTATIRATLKAPADVDKTITWSSSNTNVVKVVNGKVTAVGAGTATITVSGGGKTVRVNVTVISKDQDNMNKALAAMTPKTIDKAGVSINYTANSCTITNTANASSDGKTSVADGKATKVYRGTSAGTVESTYKVTCGSLTQNKTVKHNVPASPYTYTVASAMGITVITVNNNATNYHFTESGGLYYVASAGGVQYLKHQNGTVYNMLFNNDDNTTYAVKPAK